MCKFFEPDLDRWLLPSDRINPILNLNLKKPSVSAIEIQLTTHLWNLKPQQSRNPKQSFNSKWNYRLQSPKHFQHSTLNQLPPNFLFNFATAVNIAFKIQLKPLHSVNKNKFCPNSWQTLWGRVILVKRWRETTSVVTRKRLTESILTSWT